MNQTLKPKNPAPHESIQASPSLFRLRSAVLNRMNKAVEELPFFLLTLPLFLVINIEKQYHHFIVYRFVYTEIIWLFAAPVAIFSLSFLLFKNLKRASIYSLILLIIFYFFCDLKDYLHEATGGSFMSKYVFLLPFILLNIVLAFVILKNVNNSFRRLFSYINVTLFLFIIVDILGILFNTSLHKNDLGDHRKTILSQYKPCHECIKPDIYYIILDEYTSSDVLLKEFNYINSIDSFLSEKKFRIIPHSKSNYNLTPFSIGSCFNLNYLPSLDVHKDYYLKDYLPGLPTVYKSELIPILEKEGYSIFNHSIFNIENHKPKTPTFDLWELHTLYGRHNIFKKIDYDIGWFIRSRLSLNLLSNAYRDSRDEHLKNSIEKVMNTIRTHSSTPRFVYTHFMLPHGPYSYDSTGHQVSNSEQPLSESEERKAYVNQVRYTNSIAERLIQEIFLNEGRPFVIILQGDHGYKYHKSAKKQLEFANLNAVYFYNHDYRLISDSASNANTFRIVLNCFFKTNFKMLKDTSYFLNYK